MIKIRMRRVVFTYIYILTIKIRMRRVVFTYIYILTIKIRIIYLKLKTFLSSLTG